MATVAVLPRPCLPAAVSCRMTRCECAGVGFEELARHMRAEGLTLHDVCRRTGCGELCTACLPDLQSFLSDESLPTPSG